MAFFMLRILKDNQYLTKTQKKIKRCFDVFFAIIALFLFGGIIILLIFLSRAFFKQNGIFKQERIGYKARPFTIFKVRSLNGLNNTKCAQNYSSFIRQTRLDELPQFYNVLIGDMSVVGPRPDLSGFADKLLGDNRIILTVKPGITGPASIYFKNEELLLKKQKKPDQYNLNVIWPKKVEINKTYITEYSFFKDLHYILRTIF